MPLAPKSGKSVLTSVLDMEPRLNALHQWNFIDPLRCTEVVWGDGNRMFTGEAGGGPLDIEKQQESQRWQVSGTGPMMLDFYRLLTGSQGSMGIVTWASLKCEAASPLHAMHLAPAAKLEDLIDFVYRVIKLRLRRHGEVDGRHAGMGGSRRHFWTEHPSRAARPGPDPGYR
jgi:hypothetical protein